MADIFEMIALQRLQEAIDNGEFDHLPGAGKPLPADEFAFVPSHLRLTYSILKNSGCLPPEVQLLKDINDLKSRLKMEKDADVRTTLRQKLQDAEVHYQILMDKYRKVR